MTINIDSTLAGLGIQMHIGALDYSVDLANLSGELEAALSGAEEQRRDELLGEAASSDPVIACVRKAFKAAGKDPSRYRPSSEALTRRVLSGKALPRVNAAVDVGNIVSLMTGVPVGVYDSAKLKGKLTMRVGKAGETYQSVTRGDVNLEGLILLADEAGPFGTPYSDSGRTAVTEPTTDILFVLYGLNLDAAVIEAAAEFADTLINRFAAQNRQEDLLIEPDPTESETQ